MNLIIGAITFIFGLIIRLFLYLVSFSYNMIMWLSEVDLFNITQKADSGNGLWFSELMGRIYVLLGIFMLFRLGFSMLKYIASPDDMSNSEKGTGNIIRRVIISLVILVLLPWGSQQIMKFQHVITSSNVIGTLILGVDIHEVDIKTKDKDGKEIETNIYKNFGDLLPFTIITSLSSINENSDVGKTCKQELKITTKGNVTLQQAASNEKCVEEINAAINANILKLGDYDFQQMVTDPTYWQQWFDYAVITAGGFWPTQQIIDNNFLLLLIVACGFLYCLFVMAVDIGIRTIKIGFLLIMAPVPIIARIEPKGDKIFNNWLQEFIKTYLMLFTRFVVLYLAILVIVILYGVTSDPFATLYNFNGEKIADDNPLVNIQLKAVIALAAFVFAGQAPKLLESIFGFKMEGSMFMKPKDAISKGKSAINAGIALKDGVSNMYDLLNPKTESGADRTGFRKNLSNTFANKGLFKLGRNLVTTISQTTGAVKKAAKNGGESDGSFSKTINDSREEAAQSYEERMEYESKSHGNKNYREKSKLKSDIDKLDKEKKVHTDIKDSAQSINEIYEGKWKGSEVYNDIQLRKNELNGRSVNTTNPQEAQEIREKQKVLQKTEEEFKKKFKEKLDDGVELKGGLVEINGVIDIKKTLNGQTTDYINKQVDAHKKALQYSLDSLETSDLAEYGITDSSNVSFSDNSSIREIASGKIATINTQIIEKENKMNKN